MGFLFNKEWPLSKLFAGSENSKVVNRIKKTTTFAYHFQSIRLNFLLIGSQNKTLVYKIFT